MNFKNFLRKRFNNICFWYNRLLQQRRVFYIRLFGKANKFNVRFINKLSYTKKSDTLFILGSGVTVNELTDKQWDVIKQCDSVGFNHWLVHEFVPDLYMFQGSSGSTPFEIADKEKFFHNLRIKSEQYKHIKMIYKLNTNLYQDLFLDRIPPNLLKNIYLSPIVFLTYYDLESLRKALKLTFDKLEKSKCFLHLHTTASVFDLISFAVKFKFKKIVLAGIDLTTAYFFEEEKYKNLAYKKGMKLPVIHEYNNIWNNYKEDNVHGTERADIMNNIPISVVIRELSKLILEPRGIQLYVTSSNSKLYPSFPCYFEHFKTPS